MALKPLWMAFQILPSGGILVNCSFVLGSSWKWTLKALLDSVNQWGITEGQMIVSNTNPKLKKMRLSGSSCPFLRYPSLYCKVRRAVAFIFQDQILTIKNVVRSFYYYHAILSLHLSWKRSPKLNFNQRGHFWKNCW